MPGVEFLNHIDMNGNRITALSPGITGTDAVNVDQLNAAAAQGHAETIGDGTSTTFEVIHNFGTSDVITQIFEISTGSYVLTESRIASVNTVEVSFSSPPASGQYRVLSVPVP